MKKILRSLLPLFVLASTVHGVIVPFDLQGKGGFGLLSSNENGAIVTTPNPVGSGGEIGPGIFFDDATSELTINIGWGSGNGFLDLSGAATSGHIHGPTSLPAPGSFMANAGVSSGLNSLPGWNPSASSGGFTGILALNPAQVSALFEGRLYINIHTAQNGPGEIRGQLIAIPEPSTYASIAGALAFGVLFGMRRRKTT